jgi:hypothetical protein
MHLQPPRQGSHAQRGLLLAGRVRIITKCGTFACAVRALDLPSRTATISDQRACFSEQRTADRGTRTPLRRPSATAAWTRRSTAPAAAGWTTSARTAHAVRMGAEVSRVLLHVLRAMLHVLPRPRVLRFDPRAFSSTLLHSRPLVTPRPRACLSLRASVATACAREAAFDIEVRPACVTASSGSRCRALSRRCVGWARLGWAHPLGHLAPPRPF